MATKKASKRSKHLRKEKKLEATKPLSKTVDAASPKLASAAFRSSRTVNSQPFAKPQLVFVLLLTEGSRCTLPR